MSQLTEQIEEMDFDAVDLASRMGNAALGELSALLEHEDSAIRTMTVMVLGGMDLSISYELLFKALEDEDINVVNTAMQQIENHEAALSTELLHGLLNKVKHENAKVRAILLLGKRLTLEQSPALEPYCTAEQPEVIALNCMAALAKIGVKQRREQFSTYLLSIKDDVTAFNTMFDLIDYIDQPWVVPSLRLLLGNKSDVQSLGDPPPGFPHMLRVCDKAVPRIARLLGVQFTFNTELHSNYTDEQLAEANLAASNHQY